MTVETRTCADCKREQPVTEFYWRSKTSPYRMSYCRTCMQERARRARPTAAHTAAFRYRIPVERVQELWAAGCGVCGSHHYLTIDHDHECCPDNGRSCGSCVRGALCNTHNIALGMLGDNLDGVMRLVRYLQRE